jgi:hypothetical protein
MIRRRQGNEFWLFTQHDHALLAGALARHVGNALFAGFSPWDESVLAVDLHDCGWPAHDDQPTLNADGLPLDVFETPRHIGLAIWESSARLASERHPYCGLLVSLHSLSLSVLASSHMPSARQHDQYNLDDARARFEINRFQHGQTELQERLRNQLGLSTTIPLRMGLAETANNLAEQMLIHNFRLLQAMDQLSLSICCTEPPGEWTTPIHRRPGASAAPLSVRRPESGTLLVSPWPFDADAVRVSIGYRRIDVEPFRDPAAFATAWACAPMASLNCVVLPGP